MQDHLEPKRLEFLPYHFLLASVGDPGVLAYQVHAPLDTLILTLCQHGAVFVVADAHPAPAGSQVCLVVGRTAHPSTPAPQDTSTGQLVAQHKTRLGPCGVMAQNPWNAVLHLGHANGTVTCWTPNLSTPAVRLLAHRVRHAMHVTISTPGAACVWASEHVGGRKSSASLV